MLSDTTIAAAPTGASIGARALPQSGRLAYIDGVRAIAIVAVVAFHAHIPGFRGGFVGVDVFFVISGFLITQQIVSQMLDGRFAATDFYARRVLRILPPLLLVTVTTLAIAPLFPLLPQEARELGHSAAATAAMISNYYFTSGTEYFATHSEVYPLLHTWSLGVEEQYYLLTPAFLAAILALATRRRWDPTRTLFASGAIAIVASYIALAILSKADHRLAFFSIMTRSWQFSIGGLLAISTLKGYVLPQRLRAPLGIAGFAAIAAAIVLYDEHIAYPGLVWALPPSLGALLLIAAGLGEGRQTDAPMMRLLTSRPAVAIGLLSYSWYLWHWPLTELARTLPIGQDGLWKDIAASGFALLLSVPTFLLLERPLRNMRRVEITRRYGTRIIAGGIAVSVLIAAGAMLLLKSAAYNRPVQAIAMGAPQVPVAGCQNVADKPKFIHVTPCIVGVAVKPTVVFVGDSHAGMLAPVAEWSARAESRAGMVLSKTSCPPLLGIEIDFFVTRTCASSNDEILAWIEKQSAPAISGAVLAGRWMLYSETDTPDGEADLPRMLWSDASRPHGSYFDRLGGGLTAMLTALSPQRRVLVVAAVPELRHPAVGCLQRAQLSGQSRDHCALDRAAVESRRHEAVATLRRVVAAFPNARLIDPIDVFCAGDKCWPFASQGVFYVDTDHLSPLGAEMLYRHFERDFRWVYGEGPG